MYNLPEIIASRSLLLYTHIRVY